MPRSALDIPDSDLHDEPGLLQNLLAQSDLVSDCAVRPHHHLFQWISPEHFGQCLRQSKGDNRFIRWSRLGVFIKILAALAAKAGEPDQLMIDAPHLKAHRTAANLFKKGLYSALSGAPKAA
jgi:hypothetical protein